MKISKIRDQLQDLGETMSNPHITTCVLNALPDEWGTFVPRIYGKKEATPFTDIWELCKIEEIILKAKNDVGSNEKTQAFIAMARKKGKFGRLEPRKKFQKKIDMSKIQCYECNEYGKFNRNFTKLNKGNKKRKEISEAHVTE